MLYQNSFIFRNLIFAYKSSISRNINNTHFKTIVFLTESYSFLKPLILFIEKTFIIENVGVTHREVIA